MTSVQVNCKCYIVYSRKCGRLRDQSKRDFFCLTWRKMKGMTWRKEHTFAWNSQIWGSLFIRKEATGEISSWLARIEWGGARRRSPQFITMIILMSLMILITKLWPQMCIDGQYMISRNELTRYLQAPPEWCGYGPVKGGKLVSMIITITNNINVIWSDRWDILNEDWLNIFWSGGQGLIRNSLIRRTTID